MFKHIGKGFGRFINAILSKDKDARVPTKRQYKRITEKAARGRVEPGIAAIKHITSPLKPVSGRMDWSDGAVTHIQRLKGERPTRAMHRKMMRIRARGVQKQSTKQEAI